MHPDRIVIGGIDQRSVDALSALYTDFRDVDLIQTNNKTAEMIKYTSNALLATMISFANEIGNLCASLGGVDVVDVMRGVHKSNYLSPVQPDGRRVVAPITSFLEAGCGFGGSCLPKDVKALIAHGEKAGNSMQLLSSVIQTNEQQHSQVIALLKKHFRSLEGVRVTVLGLAFKPDTDDIRESPAIPVVKALLAEKARVKAYDPVAEPHAKKLFGDQLALCDRLSDALEDSQAIIIVTKWEEFRRVPELIRNYDPQPVLIDGRRFLDKAGIQIYEGIGL
ncbi:MAG: nucleotide sugar dehydrogenase, partial [Omnitrophica WOR_2 bacterium]